MKPKKPMDKSKKVEMSANTFFKGAAKKPGADVKPAAPKFGSTSGAPKVKPAAQAARANRLAKIRL